MAVGLENKRTVFKRQMLRWIKTLLGGNGHLARSMIDSKQKQETIIVIHSVIPNLF